MPSATFHIPTSSPNPCLPVSIPAPLVPPPPPPVVLVPALLAALSRFPLSPVCALECVGSLFPAPVVRYARYEGGLGARPDSRVEHHHHRRRSRFASPRCTSRTPRFRHQTHSAGEEAARSANTKKRWTHSLLDWFWRTKSSDCCTHHPRTRVSSVPRSRQPSAVRRRPAEKGDPARRKPSRQSNKPPLSPPATAK